MLLNNQQLLKRMQTRVLTNDDRLAVATSMEELAARAEKSPFLQEMLKKIKLKPPFNIFEYVKPYNRKGYWRRIRANREFPSIPEAEARLEFSEISSSLFGVKGVVEMQDGTRMPIKNVITGELFQGRRFTSEEEKAERAKQDAIQRIAKSVP